MPIMNSDESMRAIDIVVQDLILHIQKLETDNKELQETIRQQSYMLTKASERIRETDKRSARDACRMRDAAKYIGAAVNDDRISNRSVRLLWKALDVLGA